MAGVFLWVLDIWADKKWSNCLESPTLCRHHGWCDFCFHKVGMVNFLWLSFPAVDIHMAVLSWSYVRGGFCWQRLLAAGSTVCCGSCGGGTRMWTSGTRRGGARFDQSGFWCLCIFSVIKRGNMLKLINSINQKRLCIMDFLILCQIFSSSLCNSASFMILYS